MTRRKDDLPPPDGERSVLGCRVSDDTQRRFRNFVAEHIGNHQGAYGKAVEWAMEEYMGDDRYDRIEADIKELKDVANETNALVRRIITAEKEKGAFLEPAPRGNQAGDRREREDAVIRELVRRVVIEDDTRRFTERTLNSVIVDEADVASEPSKRDYRESLVERGLLEIRSGSEVDLDFELYHLTEAGFRLAGYEVRDGGSA